MVTPRKRTAPIPVTDPQILRSLLRIHAETQHRVIDITAGDRKLWTKPLIEWWSPMFIDRDPAKRPDHVAEWSQLPTLFGTVRAYTILADPPHAADWGQTSTIGYPERYGVGELKGADAVIEQFAPLLEVVRAIWHPTDGTLIVKMADQVHDEVLQAQPHWLWAEALRQGLCLCDEKVRLRGQPVHNTTMTQRHIRRGETFWQVYHPTAQCPGEGIGIRRDCWNCGKRFVVQRSDQRTCGADRCRQARSRARRAQEGAATD
jgi:hypothetical protein